MVFPTCFISLNQVQFITMFSSQGLHLYDMGTSLWLCKGFLPVPENQGCQQSPFICLLFWRPSLGSRLVAWHWIYEATRNGLRPLFTSLGVMLIILFFSFHWSLTLLVGSVSVIVILETSYLLCIWCFGAHKLIKNKTSFLRWRLTALSACLQGFCWTLGEGIYSIYCWMLSPALCVGTKCCALYLLYYSAII